MSCIIKRALTCVRYHTAPGDQRFKLNRCLWHSEWVSMEMRSSAHVRGSGSCALLRREGTCHREDGCDANGMDRDIRFQLLEKIMQNKPLSVSYVLVILVDIFPVNRKRTARSVKWDCLYDLNSLRDRT